MHTCKDLKKRKFTIRTIFEAIPKFEPTRNTATVTYLYDESTHSYVFNINFCPFCGANLNESKN